MFLDFPLNPDDKITIREALFVRGTATLSSGSVTITNPKITPSSIGLVSRKIAGGTTGDLRISCSAGQATITSSSSSDTSTVYYLILV